MNQKNLIRASIYIVAILVFVGLNWLLDQIISPQIKIFTALGIIKFIINMFLLWLVVGYAIPFILRKYGLTIPVTPKTRIIGIVIIVVLIVVAFAMIPFWNRL